MIQANRLLATKKASWLSSNLEKCPFYSTTDLLTRKSAIQYTYVQPTTIDGSKPTYDWWQTLHESFSQYHHGSTDQSVSRNQTYNIIARQTLFTWLWRWLPLWLSKRQSPTTVLFRTTFTRTITLYELLILLGSNIYKVYISLVLHMKHADFGSTVLYAFLLRITFSRGAKHPRNLPAINPNHPRAIHSVNLSPSDVVWAYHWQCLPTKNQPRECCCWT